MQIDRIDVEAIRRSYKLTQQQLASEIGVNLSTVWRWENGQQPKGAARALLMRLKEEAPASNEAA